MKKAIGTILALALMACSDHGEHPPLTDPGPTQGYKGDVAVQQQALTGSGCVPDDTWTGTQTWCWYKDDYWRSYDPWDMAHQALQNEGCVFARILDGYNQDVNCTFASRGIPPVNPGTFPNPTGYYEWGPTAFIYGPNQVWFHKPYKRIAGLAYYCRIGISSCSNPL